MRRRSTSGKHTAELIDDLSTLTEFGPDEWTMRYEGKQHPFTEEIFDSLVPLSPKLYRKEKESELNEMRTAAGIQPKQIFEREKDIRSLQAAAGI